MTLPYRRELKLIDVMTIDEDMRDGSMLVNNDYY